MKKKTTVISSLNSDAITELKDSINDLESKLKNDFDERHSAIVTFISEILNDHCNRLNEKMDSYFLKFNSESLVKSIVSEVHKSNDSKMDIKILALTNDLKIVKNILVNSNQGANYSMFNDSKSDIQIQDNTKYPDKNITSLNVKLDCILKEFNVLKS